ncbi:unnamed protein product [Paramecium sonneborni]|uniref:60S ribosomal protein L36 n=1 Tax=Paramecium sonneborni TaxID=65129 RepID=A0A8S1NKW5_9CILI|nr:unnamed protein product [Paramecium sonneborni]CAD8087294.1 unnamed protein product [Paramecium sonneborni]
MGRTGIAVGLNRGFITSALTKKQLRRRPSQRKGTLGKRVLSVRKVIQEVAGLSPYEKRIIELFKTNQPKDLKKAGKLAAKRLGTNRRGKRKIELVQNLYRAMRKQQQTKH